MHSRHRSVQYLSVPYYSLTVAEPFSIPFSVPPLCPQNLSNTLWALAKMEPCCRPHTATLESYLHASLAPIEGKIDTFKPQELCNTIWALATLGHPSR